MVDVNCRELGDYKRVVVDMSKNEDVPSSSHESKPKDKYIDLANSLCTCSVA